MQSLCSDVRRENLLLQELSGAPKAGAGEAEAHSGSLWKLCCQLTRERPGGGAGVRGLPEGWQKVDTGAARVAEDEQIVPPGQGNVRRPEHIWAASWLRARTA